ncbi:MAG: Rieske 2Fe-2S domain-containing protein [Candidatus Binatia bacterium]
MYRTTREKNELLTQVGRGTSMGELLRRYWWPVGISAHLKDRPTFIRVMGEDLVLFRDGRGRPGVLGAYCSHRRANLCLGDVEANGLRCRYHGWLYDVGGKVLETPGEPRDSQLKEGIRHLSYPVEELGGLVFTYLGPQPAPLVPRYDFLVGEGEVYLTIQGFQDCNWLQCVENGLDPVHPSFTHGGAWPDIKSTEPDLGFHETVYGLVYKAYRKRQDGTYNYREHHLLMPGISCGGSGGRYLKGGGAGTPISAARWSVPIDDTHTMLMRARFKPADNPGKYEGDPFTPRWKPSFRPFIEPYKEYRDSDDPVLGYDIPALHFIEDGMVVDSLPALSDRENENLGPAIDDGIIMLRKMYLEQIEAVKGGRDPKGIIRDPEKNKQLVITAYEKWLSETERREMEGATAR